jgi:hypothetical protein
VDILIHDTDRLVQHCAELNASAAAKWQFRNLSPTINQGVTGRSGTPPYSKSETQTALGDRTVSAWPAGRHLAEWCGNRIAQLARRIRLHMTSANEKNG